MASRITLKKSTLKSKVATIGFLFFDRLSEIELNLLIELLKLNNGGMVNITPTVSISLKDALSLNENTLHVSMSRLHKKRAIRKEKSLISLHPILKNVLNSNEFLLRFEMEE